MNLNEHYARLNAMPRPLHAEYHKVFSQKRRNTWIAFALWLTCGFFGAHKLYLNQRTHAIAYFTMAVTGFVGYVIVLGTRTNQNLAVLGAWLVFICIVCAASLLIALLMDLLELKRETSEANKDLEQALSARLLNQHHESEA